MGMNDINPLRLGAGGCDVPAGKEAREESIKRTHTHRKSVYMQPKYADKI